MGRLYPERRRGHTYWLLRFRELLPPRTIRSVWIGGRRCSFGRDQAFAEQVLQRIQAEVARGIALADVLDAFGPPRTRRSSVLAAVGRYCDRIAEQVDAGERSPTYLTALRYYRDHYFTYWTHKTVYDVTYGACEEWMTDLARNGLGPSTRHHAMAALSATLRWMRRRGELRQVPEEFPWPRRPEVEPALLYDEEQDAVLEAIPEPARGIYLAMAGLWLRQSEARALGGIDYRPPRLHVWRAQKGPRLDSPIRETKTHQQRWLPIPEELAAWVERWVRPERLLEDGPLFTNPATGRRWAPTQLRKVWREARQAAGVAAPASLQTGTRHSSATGALERTKNMEGVRDLLGHHRTTTSRIYARTRARGRIAMLRPPRKSGE